MSLLPTRFQIGEEQIARSQEVVKDLETLDREQDPKKFEQLRAELERLTRSILLNFIDEAIKDFNRLDPSDPKTLYDGVYIKAITETYEVEQYSKEMEQWHMEFATIDGVRCWYNPNVDEDKRKYTPVVKVHIEKEQIMHLVKTNRHQVWRIKDLLDKFVAGCRSKEFKQMSIDKILEQRIQAMREIAMVDRTEMKQEKFTQDELDNTPYIRNKPRREEMQQVA
jgi:hypothetical protein